MPRPLLLACAVAASAFVACGLDAGGTADAPGALDDGGVTLDAAIGDATGADGARDAIASGDAASFDAAPLDAAMDAMACSPGTTSCFALPSGWSVVTYASSRAAPCPAPFNAGQSDVEENPTPNAACRCEPCNVTTPPTCTSGALDSAYDLDNLHLCLLPGATLTNNPPGGCVQGQYNIAPDVRITPAAPSGGACASNVTKHKDQFTFGGTGRSCAAQSATTAGCINGVCTPAAPPAPYAICIAASGVQSACPAGPFGVKHVVGTDVTFDCAATCGCTVSAQCSGTVTFYSDQSCMDNALALVADNTCHQAPQHMNGAYGSYEYRAMASNVACTAPPSTPASNVQLVNATTICCAQ